MARTSRGACCSLPHRTATGKSARRPRTHGGAGARSLDVWFGATDARMEALKWLARGKEVKRWLVLRPAGITAPALGLADLLIAVYRRARRHAAV
jgi:hypothetical protein